MKVKWTNDARRQLKEVLRFYAKRNNSPRFSIRLKQEVLALVKHFEKSPFFGEQLGEDVNLRRVSIGYFRIIYEVKPGVIEIFSFRDARRAEE